MTLKESMDLAGRSLLAWLDPAHDHLPTGGRQAAQDTGRWWEAMLRLEAATRFPIPGDLEGAMLANLSRLTANPDRLLLAPRGGAGGQTPVLDLYSLREGLMACWALCRSRSNAWAAALGHEMVRTLDRCLTPGGVWDLDRFQYHARAGLPAPRESYQAGSGILRSTGRVLEALVAFHEVTGDPQAISLASRLAEYHLEHTIQPDGSVPEGVRGSAESIETHAYLGTLRGVLTFGVVTGEREHVRRISRAYSVALPEMVRESGWAARVLAGTDSPASDCAATAEAVLLALELASRGGYSDGYADVERLVRARLLPAQIGAHDGAADPRELGGWGIPGLPHAGKTSSLETTAAVLHALTEVWKVVAISTPQSVRVNLHLDYADDVVRMTHQRAEGEGGTATTVILCPDDRNLSIRVPMWAQTDRTQFSVDGSTVRPRQIAGYALIPRARSPGRDRATRVVTVEMPLRSRTTTETLPGGEVYQLGWKGDEIVWIDPNPGERRYYATRSSPAES